jgi:hypothetical protein
VLEIVADVRAELREQKRNLVVEFGDAERTGTHGEQNNS